MVKSNDEFLINRNGETFKVTIEDVEDYVGASGKIKDGELSVSNFDGSIEVKKFSANQNGDSNIRFMKAFIVGSSGEVRLNKTEILNNLIAPENGVLYLEGNNNKQKLAFRANTATDFLIEFTNSKVTKTGDTVFVKISKYDIEWDDVIGLPSCFKPCDHMHDLDDFGKGEIDWTDMPICDDCIVYCGEKPKVDCGESFCGGTDLFNVVGDADCKVTITFTSLKSSFSFTNVNQGLYEIDFEEGDLNFDLEITATGSLCDPALVGILTRISRDGKTLYIEDYGNDPSGDNSFDDLVITVTSGKFVKKGDSPHPDTQTVIYTSSPVDCPDGCRCNNGKCIEITRSTRVDPFEVSSASGAKPTGWSRHTHGGWSNFMNTYAITKIKENANGRMDFGSYTFNAPWTGTFVVIAAADNAPDSYLRINGRDCQLQQPVGEPKTTTFHLEEGFNKIDFKLKNTNEPVEDGGDDFSNNPMGMAYVIRSDAAYPPDPPPPECIKDSDCPDGEICVDGECVPAPECIDDKDCPPGWSCKNGVCVPECEKDKDCPPGQICKDGVCVDASVDPCEDKEFCYSIDIDCLKRKLGI